MSGCGISCRVSSVEHLLLQPSEERFLLPGATIEESSMLPAGESTSAGQKKTVTVNFIQSRGGKSTDFFSYVEVQIPGLKILQ